MSKDDENAALAWRNLAVQWHLDQGMPDCGCDDDTPDHRLCAASVAWADATLDAQPPKHLQGRADRWNHDTWVAAWGRNATIIVSEPAFKLPHPPEGMTWLLKRVLVGGCTAIEVALIRLRRDSLTTLAHCRTLPDPVSVAAQARRMLQGFPS